MMNSRQDRQWPDRIPFDLGRRAALLAVGLFIAGIPATSAALPKEANPQERVPRTQYRPVIENYVPFRPVEPRSWPEVNQDVAPRPKVKSGDQEKR
jgi:hypothetical protein